MNILICDDMPNETDRLAALLRASGFEPAVFNSGYAVIDYIQSGSAVELCFLDIVMPELDGIALAEQLRADGYTGEIVFLSSSNEYGPESYAVKALNYLLKPATRESVEGLLSELKKARESADTADIIINVSGMTRSILFREISYIEAKDHYVYFRLINGEVVKVLTRFGEAAERLLADRRFIRCHRSYIVNMNYITTTTEKEITMRGGAWIPISRNHPSVRNAYYRWKFGGERE